LLPLALLLSTTNIENAAAESPPTDKVAVIGFNDDGTRFGIITVPVDETKGRLEIWDVATSTMVDSVPMDATSPRPESLREYGFGKDEGRENYTRGTATTTSFELRTGPITVNVASQPAAGAVVMLARGSCQLPRPVAGQGTSYNLLSVRSSADDRSLAIIVKRLQEGRRRHVVVTARTDDGPLAQAACQGQQEAKASPCVGKLRQLIGKWDGERTATDSEGHARVSEFRLTIAETDGSLGVLLALEPGVGPILEGKVGDCRVARSSLEVTVGDGSVSGAGKLVLRALNDGRLNVVADVIDWRTYQGRTSVTEIFER